MLIIFCIMIISVEMMVEEQASGWLTLLRPENDFIAIGKDDQCVS